MSVSIFVNKHTLYGDRDVFVVCLSCVCCVFVVCLLPIVVASVTELYRRCAGKLHSVL